MPRSTNVNIISCLLLTVSSTTPAIVPRTYELTQQLTANEILAWRCKRRDNNSSAKVTNYDLPFRHTVTVAR